MIKINVDQEGATRDMLYVSDGSTRVWILRSDIKDSEKEDRRVISITIPKKLAIEKGLA